MATAIRSTHLVQFHDDDSSFLAASVGVFLSRGLEAGDGVVVIAASERRAAFAEALASRGHDVDAARRSGQLVMLDDRDTLRLFMIDGTPDWPRFEAAIGGLLDEIAAGGWPHVCAYGEMVDVLWREGNRTAALRLEEMWNALGRRRPLALFCSYSLANFGREADSEEFERVCQAHGQVLPSRAYRELESEEGRRRYVCLLEQRARALEQEVAKRDALEKVLRQREEELRDSVGLLKQAEEQARQLVLEREELLERERTARSQAEAANRAKDDFLAMLGHELRNPLAPIATALELARLRQRGSHELDVIERQVGQLMRLVDDLLDVSRITQGKIDLRLEPIEIARIVGDAIETVAPLFEQRRQVLSVEVPALGCMVNADPGRLRQVVTNLLTNAAKYSDSGTRIAVTAAAADGWVRLRVRDQGIGIEPHMLDRVFETFVQQRQGRDRAHGGLGLGLAIVRNLVRLHGGSVAAHSDGPGKGSEFEIELPLADSARPVNGRPRSSTASAAGAPGRTGARVLVVDDNEDAALLLAEALQALGYEVRAVHDGPSAIRVARDFKPTLGVLDLGLPVMDGYELAARLRSEPWAEGLRLVAVTGYGQDRDKALSREAGFVEHAVKPINVALLDAVLRNGHH